MDKQEASQLRKLICELQQAREDMNGGNHKDGYDQWIKAGDSLNNYITNITKGES